MSKTEILTSLDLCAVGQLSCTDETRRYPGSSGDDVSLNVLVLNVA